MLEESLGSSPLAGVKVHSDGLGLLDPKAEPRRDKAPHPQAGFPEDPWVAEEEEVPSYDNLSTTTTCFAVDD